MDGLLLVDKPAGLTSHDVVQRVRRSSGERRIGHTGTLDPRATGLLPLLLGRATRLASLLIGSDKTYDAVVRLGVATETDDEEGAPIGAPRTDLPGDDAVKAVLERFVGDHLQVPPQHSAKHVDGQRAYVLARTATPVALKPVPVTVRRLDWRGREGDRLFITVTASAGFYVRAFARDMGQALGCGAHLAGLRRTVTGPFTIERALPLSEVEALGRTIETRVMAPADALPHLPAATLNGAGLKRVVHGNAVGPEHLENSWAPALGQAAAVRVLDAGGGLIAIARPSGGALHPVVVLG
jgi:tRNA pseudouridine55 synthase